MDGHRYLPVGDDDRRELLERIGVESVDELFETVPEAVRLSAPPAVEGPLADQELRRYFGRLEAGNQTPGRGTARGPRSSRGPAPTPRPWSGLTFRCAPWKR